MKSHPNIGFSFDDFLKYALKHSIVLEIQKSMEQQSISKSQLARSLHTSRTQIKRLLNPAETGISLETLFRAATCLGKKVHVEFRDG